MAPGPRDGEAYHPLRGPGATPPLREQGIAVQPVARVEDWARALGCVEFASDAPIENKVSHAVNVALGFRETERVVSSSKDLR